MRGFRNEKQLWGWLEKRLIGRWNRVEAITPEGMPDVIGSYGGRVAFIELKVGEPNVRVLRPKQKEFLIQAQDWGAQVFVAFGSQTEKKVTWLWSKQFVPVSVKGLLLVERR